MAKRDLLRDLRKSGAIYGIGAFLFWGLYFALIRIPVSEIGWFLLQYTSSFTGVALFGLIALLGKDKAAIQRPKLVWLVALTAVLQISGSIFFNYAISHGQTAIVCPIAGSSAAVFVIIAYFLFSETLNPKQWLRILVALGGIIALSILGS
jgi:chloramphenicol-sensitive protein RarD